MKQFLLNLFKSSKKLDTSVELGNALHIIEIDNEVSTVFAGLGITEARTKELQDICKKEYETQNNIVAVMELVSKQCKHTNELALCIVMITISHEENIKRNQMRDMLDQIFKRK